jgi:hypothetical protein
MATVAMANAVTVLGEVLPTVSKEVQWAIATVAVPDELAHGRLGLRGVVQSRELEILWDRRTTAAIGGS